MMWTPGKPPKGVIMKVAAALAIIALCIGFYLIGYRDGKYFGYWEGVLKQKAIHLGLIKE